VSRSRNPTDHPLSSVIPAKAGIQGGRESRPEFIRGPCGARTRGPGRRFGASSWSAQLSDHHIRPGHRLAAGRSATACRVALLVLFCLALYLPGLAAIPPLDRDEARFAQASRQMLESGDFIRIRFQNEARDKKPILIYWLQAASVALFSKPAGTAIWPYRLPSVLAALAAALLTFAVGKRLDPAEPSAQAGFAAALLLAAALGIVAEAHIAKTDAALLAAVTAAQGALGLVYTRVRAGQPAGPMPAFVFWLGEAVAILLKGPPGPLVAILTVAALSAADRDLRWTRALRPLPGFALLAVLVLPWAVAVEFETGGRFLAGAVGHDLLPKLIGGQESHGMPPGYYAVLALATFWPGSLFLVPAFARGWRLRQMPAERFLLAWIIPAWLVFELVPTKLPHYVLPLYPALALLIGRALSDLPTRLGWADAAVRVLWGLVTVALAALLVLMPIRFGGGVSGAGISGALLLIGGTALLAVRRHPERVAALSLAFVLPAAAIAPRFDGLWLSRSAAALVARHERDTGTPIVAIGYSEPSLVFLLGTATRLLTPPAAVGALAKGGTALVSESDTEAFRAALAERGLAATAEGRVAGLDYSNGKRVVLTLYRVTRR
jgi:4-amino-4-deoxy-L-arabinose transferase-like glycosyltransferase